MAQQREPKTEGFFDRDLQERKVNRILDKAVKKRVQQATRGSGTIGEIKVPKFAPGQGVRAQKKGLGALLARAMSARSGRRSKDQGPAPSLRKSAPDTGGRSFHFEYYSVSKKDAPQSSRGGAEAGGKANTGRLHQRYIERELAVETIYAANAIDAEKALETPVVKRKRGRPSKAALAERAAAKAKEEIERDPMDQSAEMLGAGKANQAYIENPIKMYNGELALSSFGNIAEKFEDRLKFWELVEEHEPHPDARIQNRLILELPHQSTPEARREIMERFVAPLAEKGIPYHVAIHAPGEKNDSRNYHAHVVFSERPAKRMVHPETGEEVWDFTITRAYKTSSRNTKTTYPYRQKRDRDFKEWGAIAQLRKSYAQVVTAVMAGVDPTVKFDERSYKDMGLTTTPLATLHRVLHDRMQDGALVLMDEKWSKRMVAAEVDAAAQRKDPQVMRLFELTAQLEGLRDAWPNLGEVNRRLDAKSRIGGLAGFTKKIFRRTIDDRIKLESEAVKEKIIAAAEIEVCRKVRDAAKPLKEGTVTVHRKAARTPEEQQELDHIHAAAIEELAAAQQRLKSAEAEAKRRLKANAKAFQDAGHGRAGREAARSPDGPESRQRTPQKAAGTAPAAPPMQDPPATAKKPIDLTANPFVPFLPEYAEAAERRRKKRQAEAARGAEGQVPAAELGGKTAKKTKSAKAAETPAQQPEAQAAKAKPRPQMAQAAAPTQAPSEESEAERKQARERAVAQARAELLASINAQMSTMYDPNLRGQAFADSLREQLDVYYPERNGVHGPDAKEQALQTDAFARSENAPKRHETPATPQPATAPAEPAPAPDRSIPVAEQAAPVRSTAPAIDLRDLPKPTLRNMSPIRIREGSHRPTYEAEAPAPQAVRADPPPSTPTQKPVASVPMPAPATQAAAQRSAAAPQPESARPLRRAAPQMRILEESGVLGSLDPTRRPAPTGATPPPPREPAPRPTVERNDAPPTPAAAPAAPAAHDRPAPAAPPPLPSLAQESTGKTDLERPVVPGVQAAAPPPQHADTEALAKDEAGRKKKAERRKAMLSRRPTRGGRGGR